MEDVWKTKFLLVTLINTIFEALQYAGPWAKSFRFVIPAVSISQVKNFRLTEVK